MYKNIIILLIFSFAVMRCSHDVEHSPANKQYIHPPWDQYYSAGEMAVRKQNYDVAQENVLKAIEISRNNGGHYELSYNYLSDIYRARGLFRLAAEARECAFALGEPKSLFNQVEIVRHYATLGDVYLDYGDLDSAYRNYDLAQNAYSNLEEMDPRNAMGFLRRNHGIYFLAVADYPKAIEYLTQDLESVRSKTNMSMHIAKADNCLALAYYYAGNDSKAEELLKDAAGLNEGAVVGFPEDMAQSYNMLGRIAEHRRENQLAIEYYQKAYDILPMYHTVIHKVEQADVLNQIGQFQLRQGKPEESAKAYKDAMQLRRETGTATHPNCANSLKGLADVAAYRNELTSASLLATQALAVLDNSVVPTHPRTASVLIALTAIRAMSGEGAVASGNTPTSSSLSTASLNARLDTILQKPLGPWKEDFVDTASFYAQFLKKSGKQAEAARLEQLAAERKEKN